MRGWMFHAGSHSGAASLGLFVLRVSAGLMLAVGHGWGKLVAFADKAAVLVVRLTRNHPLPDGNKRLAWQALTLFCALNGHRLEVPADEAVDMMLAIAAGGVDEAAVAEWLSGRISPPAA